MVEFYLYCAMVFAMPIPIGMNRDWLWLLAFAFTLLLLCVCLVKASLDESIRHERLGRQSLLKRCRFPILCLLLTGVYALLQLVPLPQGLLGLISPSRPVSGGWAPLSVDPSATFFSALQSFFYLSLFVLTLLLVSSTSRLRTLMKVMIAAGFVQAFYGSAMTLSGIEWLLVSEKTHNTGLATGTFINRNHFAGFLEITLAVGIGYLLSQIRSDRPDREWKAQLREVIRWILGPKMRLRLCLVVMVVGLVLSHSRMGNAGFFISLLVAGTVALVLLSKAPRPLIVLIISLIVIDIIIVGTWFGFEQVVDRISQTGQYNELADRYNDSDRLDVDLETIEAIRLFPWLGSGAGSFETVFTGFRPQYQNAFFDHAHNDYLEQLLEYGFVGVLPLMLFAFYTFMNALLVQRVRRHPVLRAIGFTGVMAFVAIGIHSFVDFNLHIPANAAYLVLVAAMVWIATKLMSDTKKDS